MSKATRAKARQSTRFLDSPRVCSKCGDSRRTLVNQGTEGVPDYVHQDKEFCKYILRERTKQLRQARGKGQAVKKS